MRYELVIYVIIVVAALIFSVLAVKNDVRELQRIGYDGKRFFKSFGQDDDAQLIRRLAVFAMAFLVMSKDRWGTYALYCVPAVVILVAFSELFKKKKDVEPFSRRSKVLLVVTPLVIAAVTAAVAVLGGLTNVALQYAAVISLVSAFITPAFTVAVNWLIPNNDK